MDAKSRLAKKEAAAIDRRIDAAFNATYSGIQINIMDIPKIFRLGREAIAAGADDARLGRQIREYVESIRVDRPAPKTQEHGRHCGRCGRSIHQDDRGTVIDDSGGDVCEDDLPHYPCIGQHEGVRS